MIHVQRTLYLRHEFADSVGVVRSRLLRRHVILKNARTPGFNDELNGDFLEKILTLFYFFGYLTIQVSDALPMQPLITPLSPFSRPILHMLVRVMKVGVFFKNVYRYLDPLYTTH